MSWRGVNGLMRICWYREERRRGRRRRRVVVRFGGSRISFEVILGGIERTGSGLEWDNILWT